MICEVLGCTNRTTDKQKGISFHRFPQDEIIKQKWIDILSRDGWSPNPLGKVCSAHFKPTEISSKKALVTDTIVPSILPPLNEETHLKPTGVLNKGTHSKPTSEISPIPVIDVEMEYASIVKDTLRYPPKNRPVTHTKTNEKESVKSKFSVINELAADMNAIKSKISLHLKSRRRKNCKLRAKVDKLKRFLIEIKEENTNDNPVLASLFENALKEPPDTAIDHHLNDDHLTDRSNEEASQPPQQLESTVAVKIKEPFVLHLTNELKKLHPEDCSLIKRDIQNILEANNNKLICNEL